jgi:hypothetical protein
VNFTKSNLRNADLKGVIWQKIQAVDKANIFGVRNAPEGFVGWALEHKAISARMENE